MGSRTGGRGFKRFLEAVGSILAKFEPKPSHGDPIRDQNCGVGTYDMYWNIWNMWKWFIISSTFLKLNMKTQQFHVLYVS